MRGQAQKLEPVTVRHGKGAPFKEIDWQLAAQYAQAHCLMSEISQVLDIDPRTLKDACQREHGMPLQDWLDLQKKAGKAQLKMLRWKAAKQGGWRPIQWLSQQWLGEHHTQKHEVRKTESRLVTIAMPKNGREITPELIGQDTRLIDHES